MKTILVPTDFSDNALNAFRYALHIAEVYNAKIIALHAFHIHSTNAYKSLDQIDGLEKSAQLESNQKFDEFIERVKQTAEYKPEIIIDKAMRIGFIVEEILAEAEKGSIDLIVMGTRGANTLGTKIMGTNTASIIGNVKCPVLAVPEKATFKEIKRIIFAADMKYVETKDLDKLCSFASFFEAQLLFLNVSTNEDNLNKEQKEQIFSQIKKDLSYQKVMFIEFENSDVVEGINHFAQYYEADILAMATRKRNFWQKIFSPSLTKNMAYQTDTPLLAFLA